MSEDRSDLDSLIKRVDPDRWLSSRFIADAHLRADVIALYAFDHELARARKVASNPILGEIRLTWWGEVLDEIYGEGAVRQHPTAQALGHAVLHHQLPREPLEAMIEARLRELDPTPMSEADALAWARDTGAAAGLAARILDPATVPQTAQAAGAAWMLARRAADDPVLRPAFQTAYAAARVSARGLSVRAFPAVAHAALAPARANGHAPSGFGAQLRVTLAVARGRI